MVRARAAGSKLRVRAVDDGGAGVGGGGFAAVSLALRPLGLGSPCGIDRIRGLRLCLAVLATAARRLAGRCLWSDTCGLLATLRAAAE
jgi:hypothetical protein